MSKKRIVAVDLFCGAGGLTRGLLEAGISVRLGVDVDGACKYAYERNNPSAKFLQADVGSLDRKFLDDAWQKADVRVLAGCAPCQPFSTYTQGIDWKGKSQWRLLLAFGKLVLQCQPDVVTMENVARLARHRVFGEFCDQLSDAGYDLDWSVIDCRNLGVPQSRKRLVLIASKLGTPTLPKPTHEGPENWITVRRAIGKLLPIAAGTAHPRDTLHVSSGLTEINLRRIRASKPGGTWRDWPKELVAKCHKRKSGNTYPSVYGRMEWDQPSPTITGQCYGFGNGRFGHPEQDRAISLREAAILQTFPRDYSFVPPGTPIEFSPIGLMIGNAVPPRLGYCIGKAIKDHVRDSA